MYEIIINTSVGPFQLGRHISEYSQDYDFHHVPREYEPELWDSYNYKDGNISIYTNDGIIESIACRTDCYIDECFLFQMDVDLFFSHLGIRKENMPMEQIYMSDEEIQDVYEIDALNLQVWVNDLNKIETIFVSPDEDNA